MLADVQRPSPPLPIFQPYHEWGRRPIETPGGHCYLLMALPALDCSTMGDKTPKEKHKKDLQHEVKRKAGEHVKQETSEAQQHPTSGHPATAEHPASSGSVEVKSK